MSLLLALVGGGGPTNYSLSCAAGNFSFNGQVSTLTHARSLICSAGSFSFIGQAATLSHNRSLTCAAGSFSFTGQAATLTHARSLICSAGSFTFNGQAATFNYQPGQTVFSGGHPWLAPRRTIQEKELLEEAEQLVAKVETARLIEPLYDEAKDLTQRLKDEIQKLEVRVLEAQISDRRAEMIRAQLIIEQM